MSFFMQLLDDFNHIFAASGIERAGRFVGEDHFGACEQGAHDGDALLLTAGELFGAVVEAGPGIAAFGAVVVLTMLATMSFDARRAWDARFRPGLLLGRRRRRANPGVVSGRAG